MRRFIYSTLLLLMCSLWFGCQQTAELLEPDVKRTDEDERRSKICANVDYLTNVLEKKNYLNLYRCLTWNKEFPSMFTALKATPRKEWNHLLLPIDRIYISDRERRDKYFAFFRKLDEKNGLDDLSEILKSTMEMNFYKTLYRVFDEADQTDEALESEKVTKQDIFNLFDILNAEQKSLKNLVKFNASFVKALNGPNKNLKRPLLELLGDDGYREQFVKLVDAFFDRVNRDNITKLDKHVLGSLLTQLDDNGKPWIYNWLQRTSYESFRDLMAYSVIKHPTAVSDFGHLYQMMPNLECRRPDESVRLVMNINKELTNFVDILTKADLQTFTEFVIGTQSKIRIAEQGCQVDKIFEENQIKLMRMIAQVYENFMDPAIYEVIGFAHGLIRPNKKIGDVTYLLQFFSESFFKELTGLNELIFNKFDNGIWEPIFYILKDISPEGFIALGNILESFYEKNSLKQIESVGKIWNAFKQEDKLFLLNIIDQHYIGDANYKVLFRFYKRIFKEIPEIWPILYKDYAGNKKKKEKTFQALKTVFFHAQSDAVLKDLRKFFSRDKFLNLLDILSTSANVPEVEDDTEVVQRTTPLVIRRDLIETQEARCIKEMSQDKYDLYTGVLDFPPACKNISVKFFGFNLNRWLHIVEKDYKQKYGDQYALFDKLGVFGPEVLSWTMEALVNVDKKVKPYTPLDESEALTKTGGLAFLTEGIRDHLFNIAHVEENQCLSEETKRGHYETFENLISFVNDFVKDKVRGQDNYEEFVKNELRSINKRKTHKFVKEVLKTSHSYFKSNIKVPNYVEKHPCSKEFKNNFGVNPCPNAQDVKESVDKIFTNVSRQFGDIPTALEQLVKVLHPKHGMTLPADAKSGDDDSFVHHISLEEFSMFMLDTSRISKKLKYHEASGTLPAALMSRSEQLEVVLRDVRFKGNFYGIFYMNDVVFDEDYIGASKTNKKLMNVLKTCLNSRFCPSGLLDLPKEAKYLSKNVYNTFQVLIDIGDEHQHQYKNIKKSYRYDKMMQSLLAVFVTSSHEDAQDTAIWDRPTSKRGPKHNSSILYEIANLSGFRNMGRFFRDRFGYNKEKFFKTIQSDDFQRVDRKLIAPLSLENTQLALAKLFKRFYQGDDKTLKKMTFDAIDWINSLSYQELRLVEDSLANIAVIVSSLGMDEKDTDFATFGKKYKDNTLDRFISVIDVVVGMYKHIEPFFPKDYKLIDAFPTVYKVTKHIRNGLSKDVVKHVEDLETCEGRSVICLSDEKSKRRKRYYRLVNDSFDLISTLLLDSEVKGSEGLRVLANKFATNGKAWTENTVYLVDGFDNYIESLWHKEVDGCLVRDKKRLVNINKNLKRIVNSKYFEFAPFHKWMISSFDEEIEVDGQLVPNPHYQEMSRVLDYLASKDEAGNTNFKLLTDTVFVEHYDSFQSFLEKVFSLFKYKEANENIEEK